MCKYWEQLFRTLVRPFFWDKLLRGRFMVLNVAFTVIAGLRVSIDVHHLPPLLSILGSLTLS